MYLHLIICALASMLSRLLFLSSADIKNSLHCTKQIRKIVYTKIEVNLLSIDFVRITRNEFCDVCIGSFQDFF